MKKLLTFALVLTMALALAVPAMAATVKIAGEIDGAILYRAANEWFVDAPVAGTVTVADNKEEFSYEVVAGDNLIGLQSGYVGQLILVGFVPAVVGLTDAEFLANFIEDGFDGLRDYLSLENGVVTLTIGERSFVLSEKANNVNISGSLELTDGSGTLVFDIRGNGGNVRVFEII